ncbi:hypothetical protein [Rickettsiella endosymbiont of Dermanyssus gallinae]|uniref:hypothetical protein n=1 Tax=Rickettsiella endosymbiont of Dermanyssus gallinae TaxID=2856608 RepID=UPI001C52B36B|nr:hypothetical protein [Rickettsiella endosymbiont of Dermanyssus gallinae]
MFDVNKNDLTLLTMEYNEENVKKILMEAVKDNIKLYAQHPRKNYFLAISSGSIDKIRKNHPHSARIVLGNFCYANPLDSLTDTTDIGFNDLWINKKEVDSFLNKLAEISGTKVDSEKLNHNIENKMLGIGRDELSYLIKKYEEKHVNKILYAAMEGKIKLYILHTLADIILPISPEKIEAMVINYPEGVEIELEASDKYFNPHRVRQWSGALQVSRYAPEEFRPWCPRNSFA